jgi:hypothetical protein
MVLRSTFLLQLPPVSFACSFVASFFPMCHLAFPVAVLSRVASIA